MLRFHPYCHYSCQCQWCSLFSQFDFRNHQPSCTMVLHLYHKNNFESDRLLFCLFHLICSEIPVVRPVCIFSFIFIIVASISLSLIDISFFSDYNLMHSFSCITDMSSIFWLIFFTYISFLSKLCVKWVGDWLNVSPYLLVL